jgi:hypothetical protein
MIQIPDFFPDSKAMAEMGTKVSFDQVFSSSSTISTVLLYSTYSVISQLLSPMSGTPLSIQQCAINELEDREFSIRNGIYDRFPGIPLDSVLESNLFGSFGKMDNSQVEQFQIPKSMFKPLDTLSDMYYFKNKLLDSHRQHSVNYQVLDVVSSAIQDCGIHRIMQVHDTDNNNTNTSTSASTVITILPVPQSYSLDIMQYRSLALILIIFTTAAAALSLWWTILSHRLINKPAINAKYFTDPFDFAPPLYRG